MRKELRYLVAIAAAVLAANVPYLVGAADADPLGTRSGLARVVDRGPLPGERSVVPNAALIHGASLPPPDPLRESSATTGPLDRGALPNVS